MKIGKAILIAAIGYVGLVAAFESMIGVLQPTNESTLTISTQDESGAWNDRVLAHLTSGGKNYVAANHWPRAWYNQALANPEVEVTLAEGAGSSAGKGRYVAVPVDGAEYDQVQRDNPTGLVFRFITGFPPRLFLRLDPQVAL